MRKMAQLAPEARATMGQAGRAKMERVYDERIVIRRYMDEVARLAAGKNRPQGEVK